MKSKKKDKKKLPKVFVRFKKKDKAKKNIKESILRLVNNLLAGKPTVAKNDLKRIVDEKIKQKIINNSNTTLF